MALYRIHDKAPTVHPSAYVAESADVIGNVTLSDGDTGTGYGAGLIWDLGMLDLRAEYTRYDFDGEADTFSMIAHFME